MEWKISTHPLPIASTLPPPPQAKPSSATKENSKVYELAEIYPCFGRTSYCSQWIILHNMNRGTALHLTDPCLQIWRITIKSFLFYEGTFTHIYISICICIESKIGRNTLMVLAEVVVRKIQSHTTVQ